MTEDQERWAEALAVERQFGDLAYVFVEKRISDLVTAGHTAGVERWKAIASRLDQLKQARKQ
jgi:hypothetical protein